jgi:hypothetical protein
MKENNKGLNQKIKDKKITKKQLKNQYQNLIKKKARLIKNIERQN